MRGEPKTFPFWLEVTKQVRCLCDNKPPSAHVRPFVFMCTVHTLATRAGHKNQIVVIVDYHLDKLGTNCSAGSEKCDIDEQKP